MRPQAHRGEAAGLGALEGQTHGGGQRKARADQTSRLTIRDRKRSVGRPSSPAISAQVQSPAQRVGHGCAVRHDPTRSRALEALGVQVAQQKLEVAELEMCLASVAVRARWT